MTRAGGGCPGDQGRGLGSSPLRPACEPALATRSPALAVRRDFRHPV